MVARIIPRTVVQVKKIIRATAPSTTHVRYTARTLARVCHRMPALAGMRWSMGISVQVLRPMPALAQSPTGVANIQTMGVRFSRTIHVQGQGLIRARCLHITTVVCRPRTGDPFAAAIGATNEH